MAMVVKNNMSAVSTLNTLNKNSSALQKSLSKVSSGMKINSAQDDASGYAISERMRVQIRSLDQANQNTQNGSSMMKTAEGAVSSTVEILKSLKEKAINAANDTNKDADRVTIQKEIDQFIDQIDDNALTTFNGKYLVDGSKSQEGNATYTAMTNQSLCSDTVGSDKLTALKNRNGDSLEIASTDYITASYVQNGNTYTTKWNVGTDTDLEAVFTKLNTLQTTSTGTAVEVFGPAQTSTEKMTAADAAAVLSDLAQYSSDIVADLKAVAAGNDTATQDSDGNLITADKFKAAISTLTDDAVGSTTGQILSTLGVTDATATAATSISDALAAVESTLSTAAQAGMTTGDGSASATNATINNGTYATANISVTNTFTSAAGGISYTITTTGSGIAANGTGIYSVAAGGGTATPSISAAQFGDKVVAAVKDSVDNTGTKAAAETMAANATTITAGTASGTVTGVPATGDPVTVDATAATLGVTAGTALTGTAADDLAITYAFSKISGGALVNGNTSAVGLKTSGDLQSTADGENGVTVTAKNNGVSGQISGLTLSITDSEGNVKKAANASLDAFSTTVYAKNKSDRNELSFQVGAAANQAIAVGLDDMRSEALGLKGSDGSKVSVATQDKANAAINVFDNAIQKALDQQTTIGSIEARLEYTSQNLTTSSENVQAAESTIRDADMAKEMTNYTKNNVLLQAAQSMLAQANQSSSAVLSLLQ